jgi:menaquinol-cytochrome c reductase iron-sulfur subunit
MNRRTLMKILVHGGGMITAGIVGIPALLMAISPVLRRRTGEVWQPVGRLDDFPVDEVREAVVEVPRDDWSRSLRSKGVYVWRPTVGEAVVYSRNCTDLSCPVTWDAGSQWFYCPCHGGMFAKNGDPTAGPPQRPLYRYAYRIRDGVLEIDLNSLPSMT